MEIILWSTEHQFQRCLKEKQIYNPNNNCQGKLREGYAPLQVPQAYINYSTLSKFLSIYV